MSGRQILVIDDDESIRDVTQLSLERLGGWQVSTAASGSDGLAKAAAERPDVILLDVMMPEMDGPSTLGRLRAHPLTQGIPVIFLTAKVRRADLEGFARLGAAAVIAKPFDPMSLSAQILMVLDGSR